MPKFPGFAMLEFTLLGEVSLRSEGIAVRLPNSKSYALLAYLCLENERASIPDIADLLWPATELPKARHSLSQLVYGLSRALRGYPLISRKNDVLTLDRSLVLCDVREFERHAVAGDCVRAVSLYGGIPLQGLTIRADERFEHWRERVIARVQSVYSRCIEALSNESNSLPPSQVESWTKTVLTVMPIPEVALLHYRAIAEQERQREAEIGIASFLALADDMQRDTHAAFTTLLSSLSSTSARKETPTTDSGIRPKFLGRTNELSFLLDAWHLAKRGELGTVVILGDAGIGKTRLLDHFARVVALRGGQILTVSASAAARRIPFAAAAELLKQVLDRTGLIETAPHLAALIGLSRLEHAPTSQDPAAITRLAYLQAQTALETLVGNGPVLVALDDLQWIDDSSLDLLLYLAHVTAHRPILFAAAARPEVEETVTRLTEVCPTTLCRLGPLSGTAAEQLLAVYSAARGKVFGRTAVDLLLTRSAGNPFFLLALADDDDALGSSGSLPETITALVAARIRQLSLGARDILRILAVARVPESIDTIAEIGSFSLLRAARGIEELVRFQLAVDADGVIRTAHDVIAEAVYGSMQEGLLSSLHRRLADRLHHRGNGYVAHHAWKGGDRARAHRAATDAATHALSIRAYSEAEYYYRLAIASSNTEKEVAAASAAYVNFAFDLESTEMAAEHVPMARRHFVSIGDDAGSLRCDAIDLDCSLRHGTQSLKQAAESADALVSRAEVVGGATLAADIASVSWRIAELGGDPRTIVQWISRALAIAAGSTDSVRVSLVGKAAVLGYFAFGPEWTEATSSELAGSHIEDPRVEALATAYRGAALMLIGRLQEAEQHYLRALDLAQDPILSDTYSKANLNLAVLDIDRGRFESARQRLTSRLPGRAAASEATLVSVTNIGYLGLEAGRLDDAEWAVSELKRRGATLAAPAVTCAAGAIAGLAAWERGDKNRARAEAEALEPLVERLSLLSDDSYCVMLLARVESECSIHAAIGRLEEARQTRRPAVPQLRVELEHALLMKYARCKGFDSELETVADKAERMGAIPIAHRARAALEGAVSSGIAKA